MTGDTFRSVRIAAIVPCHNEERAVAKVVADLKAALPQVEVYVYDNDSTDRTAEVAEAAGAEVRCEPLRGKGHVIRRAMADLDADVYLMIDGDDTYDASAAPEMVRVLLEGPYDQVTGVRVASMTGAYRSGHELGNRVFNRVVSVIFRRPVTDMLSGYRVFSRRFVKSFPAVSRAFEIETELTVHAINTRVPAGRGAGRVQGPRRGVGQQAAHLPRRLPDHADDHPAAAPRASAGALLDDRRR